MCDNIRDCESREDEQNCSTADPNCSDGEDCSTDASNVADDQACILSICICFPPDATYWLLYVSSRNRVDQRIRENLYYVLQSLKLMLTLMLGLYEADCAIYTKNSTKCWKRTSTIEVDNCHWPHTDDSM